MKKTLILIAVFALFAAIAGAQCTTAISIVGSGLYAGANKCYGTIDTYNAMTNRNGFYYDYMYSAFVATPIACETPVTNTGTVEFIGRTRNWGNNGNPCTLYSCPTTGAGQRTAYASWGTNGTGYVGYLIMEACPWVTTNYQCNGTGLGARVANISCNGATTGVDYQFHPAAPAITSTVPAPCSNPAAGCTLSISIAGPTTGAGIYGDTAGLVSGYRIYTYQAAIGGADPGGATGAWTATANYIPYAGATSTGSFSFTWPNTSTLWIGYAPVFNNSASTAISTLAQWGLTTTGFLAGGWAKVQPTDTTFESFSAHYADLETVSLNWVTASENDAMGFNLYRSLDGVTWAKVNPTLIQAMGQGGGGSSYAYTDNLPKQRTYQAWQYKVEELSNAGSRLGDVTTEVTR